MADLSGYDITVFGDSIPEGVVTRDGKITKLENGVVNLVAMHYGIKIKNISIYGQTLKKIYTRGILDNYIDQNKTREKDGAKKEVCVMFIGGNDSDYDWKSVAETPDLPHESKSSVKEFFEMYDDVLKKMKAADIMPVAVSIPPVDSDRYFNAVIKRIADGDKVLQFFDGDLTNITRHQECFNIAIMNCSRKNGVAFVDVRTPMLLKRKTTDYLCEDGIHPNEQGHLLMADACIAELEEGDV